MPEKCKIHNVDLEPIVVNGAWVGSVWLDETVDLCPICETALHHMERTRAIESVGGHISDSDIPF